MDYSIHLLHMLYMYKVFSHDCSFPSYKIDSSNLNFDNKSVLTLIGVKVIIGEATFIPSIGIQWTLYKLGNYVRSQCEKRRMFL